MANPIIAEARHALLAGWFGAHFEPHPTVKNTPEKSESQHLALELHSPGDGPGQATLGWFDRHFGPSTSPHDIGGIDRDIHGNAHCHER